MEKRQKEFINVTESNIYKLELYLTRYANICSEVTTEVMLRQGFTKDQIDKLLKGKNK